MDIRTINNVYFVGIGGIGMSAIARYFKVLGKNVAGYDRTQTALTKTLESEGIEIHYEDNLDLISDIYKNKQDTLVVFTPAIPNGHKELIYFKENDFVIQKRSEVLGLITKYKKGIAIAGTHGKTTVSTITAHVLNNSKVGCSAFLGGIAKNYESNLLVSEESEYVVVEADEFDRSFLTLFPDIAVVTSVDADHLDIYGDKDELKSTFKKFVGQIRNEGKVIVKKGIDLDVSNLERIEKYSYALDTEADFYAQNITIDNGLYVFDIVTPETVIKGLTVGLPGLINVENTVAAVAVAYLLGVDEDEIRDSLKMFTGVKRRFDVHIKTDGLVFIDDYAHHPEELKAAILSARDLYKGRKLTGIFQPHLFTRTRDFVDGFAQSLDMLDELILLDIYPARELPIEGVTSKIIFDKMQLEQKTLCKKEELLEVLKDKEIDVLLTLGAGDIDKLVDPVRKYLQEKNC